MPKQPAKGPRARHGTRKLILKVFGETGASSSLTTSAIVERVSKEAGTKIPDFSVYSALRTLVRRKVLKAKRVGHEKAYTFLGSKSTARAPKALPPPTPVKSNRPEPASALVTPEVSPSAVPSTGIPHKLAVGEALILHVGEEHVEAVTNVHGRLVVERHPRRTSAG